MEIFTNECLSPMSTTPAISCSAVSTTPAKNLWQQWLILVTDFHWCPRHRWTIIGSDNDTGDGVFGTAMKIWIHKHPTHLDQRPLRPPTLNNDVLVWRSFGGLRDLWSGCMRSLCAFSWRFQWQYWRPWLTSAAGDSFAERTDLCSQYSLSPVEAFIAVSWKPVNSLSPVSLTLVNNSGFFYLILPRPKLTVFSPHSYPLVDPLGRSGKDPAGTLGRLWEGNPT